MIGPVQSVALQRMIFPKKANVSRPVARISRGHFVDLEIRAALHRRRELFDWIEQLPGLGNIFSLHFIDEDKDCFRRFVRFFAYHVGDSFGDVRFLFFCEGSGDSNVDVGHNNSFC